MGKNFQPQGSSSFTERTLRTRISWCWQVKPRIPMTGEIYNQVQIDGIYLPYGWCLLVALAQGKVIAWQWCDKENKNAYHALFSRLADPLMVVTDGHAAALTEISNCWPDTRVQRCLVHIKRNIRTCASMHPKLPAPQALWGLAKQLVTVRTIEESTYWLTLLHKFYEQFAPWVNEKTWRRNTLPGDIPHWVKSTQEWWWTHYNARRAYKTLEKHGAGRNPLYLSRS